MMRQRLRCSLPGFKRETWGPPYEAVHMGGLPVIQTGPTGHDPDHPPEDTTDGCPGGWYRCEFVSSLLKYERLLGESTFSNNVLLDRSDDRLVIEATQYLETERLRSRAFWAQQTQ